jgi:hypothetical protein
MTEETHSNTGASRKPGIVQALLSVVSKPKPTGASCEYCGWHGARSDILMSPRLNEDGTVYQITTCPSCMRNGGLVLRG